MNCQAIDISYKYSFSMSLHLLTCSQARLRSARRWQPWQRLIAPRTMPAAQDAVVIIASALAALLGWVIWRRARHAIRYDLHKIPGPQQTPLLGNIASVIGSSYVHRVRRFVPLIPKSSLHGSRQLHARRSFSCLYAQQRSACYQSTLSNICRTACFETGRVHLT